MSHRKRFINAIHDSSHFLLLSTPSSASIFYRDKSRVYPTMKNDTRRNGCNKVREEIDVIRSIFYRNIYSLHRGGIYKGNLRRIERNRRLMPSRRFLAADLSKPHSRILLSGKPIGISATICLVSMIAPRFPGLRDLSISRIIITGITTGIPAIARERP